MEGKIGIIVIIFLFFGMCALVSANGDVDQAEVTYADADENKSGSAAQFKDIDGDLVYDIETKVVYVKSYTYCGYYTLCPYYAANGLPYRYVNDKLETVSVSEDKNNLE